MLGTSRSPMLQNDPGEKYWSCLSNALQPLSGAVLYINEGKVRRVYTRLKPPENSDKGSAKIECNSLQGRHLWHFLFAKPCRYSSMTGSVSGALFWVPAFILLIISFLSRSLKCSTRPGCFKFCQYIVTYFTKKSLRSPWQFHFSNFIRTFS